MNNLAKSTYVNLLSSKTFYAVKRNTNKTTAKQRTCGEKKYLWTLYNGYVIPSNTLFHTVTPCP